LSKKINFDDNCIYFDLNQTYGGYQMRAFFKIIITVALKIYLLLKTTGQLFFGIFYGYRQF